MSIKIIYDSVRPESQFRIVEHDGKFYAIDEDTQVPGWGKFLIDRPCKFMAGTNEFISVTPEGDVERIETDADDCVFFGDFDFVEDYANLF